MPQYVDAVRQLDCDFVLVATQQRGHAIQYFTTPSRWTATSGCRDFVLAAAHQNEPAFLSAATAQRGGTATAC